MFNASIEYWPSSTRAEIFAILSALIISPKHSTIQIYTDSQTTIHGFYSHITQQSFSIRTKEKSANYTLWYLIQYIMESSELQVYLHKVKAHNGDLSNNIADSLAKAGRDLPSLSPSLVHTPRLSLIYAFNNIPIESSIRQFFKNLSSASNFSVFLDLNRNDHIKTQSGFLFGNF